MGDIKKIGSQIFAKIRSLARFEAPNNTKKASQGKQTIIELISTGSKHYLRKIEKSKFGDSIEINIELNDEELKLIKANYNMLKDPQKTLKVLSFINKFKNALK